LPSIGRLSALQSLKLGYCPWVSDGGLHELSALTALRTLNLKACRQITDGGVRLICQNFTLLQALWLNACGITDNALTSMHSLKHLEKFECASNNVTDVGIHAISRLTRLESLNLSGCQLTDLGLQSVCQLPRLKYLCIWGCHQVTRNGFDSLFRTHPLLDISR